MARAIWLTVLLLSLIACGAENPPVTPIATPPGVTATLARPLPTSSIPGPSSVTPTPAVAASDTITLTIWAPEDFAPGPSRGGQVLRRQLDEFTRAHPKIGINFVLKSPHGKGGILDFMLKAQALVPGRLPDLVWIDSREVDVAVDSHLLQPLDRDLASGAFTDLLAPAQTVSEVDGRRVNLPVTLDVQHLVYNTQIVRSAPRTWDDVLSGGAPFAFAADGDDAFLLQYLDNGGRVSRAASANLLDVNATTTALGFFQKARASKLIPDNVLGIKTAHEVWPLFAAGQAPLAQVEARDYLAERERVANVGYGSVPTRDGRPTAMVSGWSVGIITADPARHRAAAEFLNWINQPTRVAEWANAARLIPARRSAFGAAIKNQPYTDFLLPLLEEAIPAPSFSERAGLSNAFATALQSVLRGQSTPNEAAARAAQLVSQ